MPAIDFNDFTTQLLCAVILGVVLLLVHRSWMRNVKADPASLEPSAASAAVDGTVIGDEPAVDDGPEPRGPKSMILHNIESSPDAIASDDDYGKVAFVVTSMGVAAVIFLLARPMHEALSYGTIVSTVLMAMVAGYRTQTLNLWSAREIATAVTVLVAGVAAVVTWRTSAAMERDGMSISSIGDVVPAFSEKPDQSLILNYFDYVVDGVIPAFFGVDANVLAFAGCLVLAAMAATALCIFALSAVWDWNAYLSFSKGRREKKNVVARARSHEQGGPVGLLVWTAAFAAVAVVSANGLPYDLFVDLTSN